VAVWQAALVSDESALEACLRRCAIQIDDLYLLPLRPHTYVGTTPFLLAVEARDKRERTPLHYAASVGNIDAIIMLLDSGANTSVQDVTGVTPLHLSVCQTLSYLAQFPMSPI